MAVIISTLTDFITFTNSLYNGSADVPTSGDEDYTVWTSYANVAVNLWERENTTWKELIVSLDNAPDGGKTVIASTWEYDLPALFRFPMSGIVWTGSGTDKTPYTVIKPSEKQLYETNSDNWCYFLNGHLEFNPNCTMTAGETIRYDYYKKATKLTTGSSTFEMSDPMFAVYYALSELRKDEGDTSAATIATQKLTQMKDENDQTAYYQSDAINNQTEGGMGY